MTRSVFFRCRIIELTAKQNTELKKIYEAPLLWKLGLGKKFLRKLLYVQRIALGVGLLQPKIVIVISAL